MFAICLSFYGCQDSAKNYPVQFINRSDVFSHNKKTNPFMLIVEITEDGKLSLNKIETGTIADPTVLSEKIKAVFDDREKNEISKKEVCIDRKGEVKNDDLIKLIEVLERLNASSVRVIKEK